LHWPLHYWVHPLLPAAVLLAPTPPGGGGDTSTTSELKVDESKVTLWLFAETHSNYFEWVTEQYTSEHPDVQFDIQVMDTTAMNDRLAVIITAGGEGTPDLIDMEQGQFPLYMNEEKMFFEPLNDRMEADGILDKMVENRLSLYSYNGNYYGIEHALCPVTMAYRPDLFEQAGIEVPTTWDEYKAAAEKFAEEGIYIATMGDLVSGFSDDIDLYLKASGNSYVNEDGTTNIVGNDALKNMLDDVLYMQQNDMILPVETDEDRWNAIAADEVATYYTPDWAAGWLRDNVPEQSGMWKMAYLPQYDSNSARTSCSGGTGFCMSSYTKKDKDMLWDFMKYAMIQTDNVVKKYEMINLYPPVYEAMPLCNGPVEYYDNQVLGDLYTELAEEMPKQNQAPWRGKFSESFKNYSYDWVEGNMTTDELLQAVQDDVDAYIAELG
jgi:arabinosaccharide transport system substrate-binding protein